ncbi:MAG: hypothetical protein OXC10_16100 [Rhodospirillaceae bacterium]|nr:hypothetical protein [Rhodospirillaceae bacterium]
MQVLTLEPVEALDQRLGRVGMSRHRHQTYQGCKNQTRYGRRMLSG